MSPSPGTAPKRCSCAHCQRPVRSCLCAWVRPTANRLPVLVLQHPLEQHQAKGSLRLLGLSLARCQVVVGEQWDADALRALLTADGLQPVLLYPPSAESTSTSTSTSTSSSTSTTTSTPPLADAASAIPTPSTHRLVVLDGTWRKTRKLLLCNPVLQALPRWSLPEPPPSRYAIRRAQAPEQRSTLEATCLALSALEGDAARYAPLQSAFDGWVAQALALADAGRATEAERGGQ